MEHTVAADLFEILVVAGMGRRIGIDGHGPRLRVPCFARATDPKGKGMRERERERSR